MQTLEETNAGIRELGADGVELKMDYVSIVDPETFEEVDWEQSAEPERVVVICGAMWAGKTRLIDNVLCGDTRAIFAEGE